MSMTSSEEPSRSTLYKRLFSSLFPSAGACEGIGCGACVLRRSSGRCPCDARWGLLCGAEHSSSAIGRWRRCERQSCGGLRKSIHLCPAQRNVRGVQVRGNTVLRGRSVRDGCMCTGAVRSDLRPLPARVHRPGDVALAPVIAGPVRVQTQRGSERRR